MSDTGVASKSEETWGDQFLHLAERDHNYSWPGGVVKRLAVDLPMYSWQGSDGPCNERQQKSPCGAAC
eukprot:1138119-Pelagomonas_calceolata.AAC.6